LVPPFLHSFPTRRSSDLTLLGELQFDSVISLLLVNDGIRLNTNQFLRNKRSNLAERSRHPSHENFGWDVSHKLISNDNTLLATRSEEHTSELQSRVDLVC